MTEHLASCTSSCVLLVSSTPAGEPFSGSRVDPCLFVDDIRTGGFVSWSPTAMASVCVCLTCPPSLRLSLQNVLWSYNREVSELMRSKVSGPRG